MVALYKIDHWVIENSIRQMATIQEQFGWLSINLSGQTIAYESTYAVIENVIKNSGMVAEKLNEIGVDDGQGCHLHLPCSIQSLIDDLQIKRANG